MTSRRLPEGGTWVDRSKPIGFRFDGAGYEGFEGDTLASALLANGVVGGFRSPIQGRPRGIFSAGIEEPNALVAVREPWVDLIVPATVVPLVDGLVAEPSAGVTDLADGGAPTQARHRHRHVETLVVGAGPAGRSRRDPGGGQRRPGAAGRRTTRARRSADRTGRDGDAERHGARRLRRRLRGGARTRSNHGDDLAHPGRERGARDRRSRAADRVRGQRPARRDARRGGGRLRRALRCGSRRPRRGLRDQRLGPRRRRDPPRRRRGGGTNGRRAQRGGGHRGSRGRRRRGGRRSERRRNDRGRRCRPPRDLGWVEPRPHAVAVDRRRSPLPRHVGVLRSGRRSLVALGDRRSRRRPPRERLRAVRRGGRRRVEVRRPPARPDGGRHRRDPRERAPVGRAREAGDVHRNGRGSGTDERGPRRRDRERDAGRGARRAGAVERPAAVRAGVVRSSGRAVRRRPARPDPNDADPPLARRTRGGVRGRRAVEAAVVLPLDGESMEQAVERECLAVRDAVGAMDASTLGKIEVVGTDAPAFLDRMYTNPDVEPQGRRDPLRPDARSGRDGPGRRRRDAAGRGPVPRDDHDGRRGDGARPVRGVAPDRMARAEGLVHQRHRAMGGDRGQRTSRA